MPEHTCFTLYTDHRTAVIITDGLMTVVVKRKIVKMTGLSDLMAALAS